MKLQDSRCGVLALCALPIVLSQHTFAQASTRETPEARVQEFVKASGDAPLSVGDTARELSPPARTAPSQDSAPLARESAPGEILALADATPEGLLFDESADGTLWARGRSYKASFAGAAATVLPFFGSEAPQNFPVEFRASGATLAGEVLHLEVPARAVRSDRTVRIDRAAFVEEYVLEEERLEQRFVFDTLPRRGEILLRIDVVTELSALDLGHTLRFSNELGHVDYGEAFAIDANGARIAIERSFVDGAITLTVPSAFVATAALPLTIDPLVSVFTVSLGSLDKTSPDVSYDVNSGRWCVVYEDVFSVSDHDVTAKLFSSTGALEAILTIDATSDYWTTPKVANNRNANTFLIVGAVDPAPVASNTGSIRGRRLNAVGATLGPVIQISPSDATERFLPDVGGDAFNGSNAHFCVVWQHNVSSSIDRIEMQMVTQNGLLQGGVVTLEGVTGRNTRPAISNSNGLVSVNGPTAERWTVVWQYEFVSSDHDIYARQVAWNGALLSPAFIVDDSTSDETEPQVSSVLDPIAGQRFALVAYRRFDGADADVMGSLLSGSTVVATQEISADPAASIPRTQISPKVDSDGRHFLVGYVEHAPVGFDPNVLISDYFVSGGALVPWREHETFAGTPSAEFDFALHSQYSSGGSRVRYLGAWSFGSPSPNSIQGGLWDGGDGGVVSSVCAGDGSGTSCPCGNTGGPGRGCANSETGGALLAGTDGCSVGADTFVLQGSGMPAFSTCLYFQGSALNASGAGFVFGDGKLCASGTVIRLGVKANSGGASNFPSIGNPSVSALGLVPAEGATRFYQVWYRDSAAFCTNFAFNLTNALQVVWAP